MDESKCLATDLWHLWLWHRWRRECIWWPPSVRHLENRSASRHGRADSAWKKWNLVSWPASYARGLTSSGSESAKRSNRLAFHCCITERTASRSNIFLSCDIPSERDRKFWVVNREIERERRREVIWNFWNVYRICDSSVTSCICCCVPPANWKKKTNTNGVKISF